MPLKLTFAHADNGSATAQMVLGDAEAMTFDYVTLVKWLFEHQDETITADITDSYSDDQKTRIRDLLRKIEVAAKGSTDSERDTEGDSNEIPVGSA